MALSKAEMRRKLADVGVETTDDQSAAELRQLLLEVGEGDGGDGGDQGNQGPGDQADSDAASDPSFAPAFTPVSEDIPRPAPEMGYAAPYFNPRLHVLIEKNVDDHGSYIPLDHPEAGNRPRRITIDGKNFEHVAEDPATGGWIYREMP